MKTKIDVKHIKLGMRVCELDRAWVETPFLMPGFRVESETDLEELRRYCHYVFIETEDDEDKAAVAEFALLKMAAYPRPPSPLPALTLTDELPAARQIYTRAVLAMEQAIFAARAGLRVPFAPLRDAARELSESVGRHADAVLLVARLTDPVHRAVYRSTLALLLAWHLGLPREEREAVGLGALLADLGLARAPDELLGRPGPLTPQEHKLLQRHVADSILLLEGNDLPNIARELIARHHERYDGSGYPRGLSGADIGRYGLLGGLIDHFAAITADRPYRRAASPFHALQSMYLLRGKAFCPALLEEFVHAHGIYAAGCRVELGSGRIGVVIERHPGRPLKPRLALVNAAGYPYAQVDLALQSRDEHGRPWEIGQVCAPEAAHVHGQALLAYLSGRTTNISRGDAAQAAAG